MTKNQTTSWIFLATAIASQTEPADFSSISDIADGINHAIPTHKELQSSLNWMARTGLVTNTGNLILHSLLFIHLMLIFNKTLYHCTSEIFSCVAIFPSFKMLVMN